MSSIIYPRRVNEGCTKPRNHTGVGAKMLEGAAPGTRATGGWVHRLWRSASHSCIVFCEALASTTLRFQSSRM